MARLEAVIALLLLLLPPTADGSTVLSKGVTRNGLVNAGSKFYKLQLACPDSAAQLQLSLTSLQGAVPTLYVSTSLQQPGPSGWTWMGNSSAPINVPFPSAGMYYLGVTSTNASAFKLLASVTLASGERASKTWRPDACD
jgi:hypothetical protein